MLQSKYHFTSQPCSVIMYKNTVTNATTVRDRCKSAERLRLPRAISLVELSHYSDLFLLPSRVGVGKTAGLGTLGWVVTRLNRNTRANRSTNLNPVGSTSSRSRLHLHVYIYYTTRLRQTSCLVNANWSQSDWYSWILFTTWSST